MPDRSPPHAESTRAYRSQGAESAFVLELVLDREEESGIIFISSDEKPDIFIAVTKDSDVRPAVERCLKDAFADQAKNVQVYVNGKIGGPQIGVMVKLTD